MPPPRRPAVSRLDAHGHLNAETRALIMANMREIVRRRSLRAVPADSYRYEDV